MPLRAQVFPFTAKLIAGAPERAGVYALWLDGEIIFVGHARGGSASIRACLVDHYSGAVSPCTRRASHYSWEISRDPADRERSVLEEYVGRHSRLPRCNAAR